MLQILRTAGSTGERGNVNSVATQRSIFLVSAVALVLVSALLTRPDTGADLLVAGALIVALGVPHGALDVLYLRKILRVRPTSRLLLALLGYVGVAVGVVVVWLLSPVVFLMGFLAASGFHFSGDPEEGASTLMRISVGMGVIALPSLRHGQELEYLYGLLTNPSAASVLVQISLPLAMLVVGIAVVALIVETTRKRYGNALELIGILLTATFVSPLLAFTTYFCLMHSARHILRTVELANLRWRAMLVECTLPMLSVLVVGAVAFRLSPAKGLDAKVIQILFVSLAALTAPHMIIVEPIRFRGWRVKTKTGLSDGSLRSR
ncbi:MAG: Brp/Blh family beta-carotene 15,15'-dioxygenase [Fimbriimonas sp.]